MREIYMYAIPVVLLLMLLLVIFMLLTKKVEFEIVEQDYYSSLKKIKLEHEKQMEQLIKDTTKSNSDAIMKFREFTEDEIDKFKDAFKTNVEQIQEIKGLLSMVIDLQQQNVYLTNELKHRDRKLSSKEFQLKQLKNEI